jgi:hypothetical protein
MKHLRRLARGASFIAAGLVLIAATWRVYEAATMVRPELRHDAPSYAGPGPHRVGVRNATIQGAALLPVTVWYPTPGDGRGTVRSSYAYSLSRVSTLASPVTCVACGAAPGAETCAMANQGVPIVARVTTPARKAPSLRRLPRLWSRSAGRTKPWSCAFTCVTSLLSHRPRNTHGPAAFVPATRLAANRECGPFPPRAMSCHTYRPARV